jgi:hypothetical protein
MLLDVNTTAAYAPPPALYERFDWLSDGTAPQNPLLPVGTSDTTETRLFRSAPDPEKQYAAERTAKQDASRQINAEIMGRVQELVRDALWANEPVSLTSLSDFGLFLSQISYGCRPAIYLLDNGNLRAVWKNAENEQAAFQFRGGSIVHCVVFLKRKTPQLPLNQEMLIDIIPKIRARLTDFMHLLQG